VVTGFSAHPGDAGTGTCAAPHAADPCLQALFEQSLVGVARLDADGRYVDANPRYCAMVGRERADVLTLCWSDLVPAGHSDGRSRLFQQPQGGNGAIDVEHACQRPDGKTAWLRTSLTTMKSADGSPAGVLAVAVDIGDQRAATAALDTSRVKYSSLFDSMDAGFCILELKFDAAGHPQDYRFVEINPAFERQTGLADALGRWAREMAPTLEQHWFDIYGQVALTGERARFENFAGALGNRWFDVHAFAMGDARPAPVAVLFTDITDKKRSEEVLRESEAQFRSFAQAMPNHVWTAPPDGKLDWFNDRVYEYSGLDAARLIGDGWAAMVHPDDITAAARAWGAALRAGQPYETEFRLRRADGHFRWHIARAVPLQARDGGIARWVGTNTDIHDQRVLRQQLIELNASLEQQVAERTLERDRIWHLMPDLLTCATLDGNLLSVNPAWGEALGFDEPTLLSRPFSHLIHPEHLPQAAEAIDRMRRGQRVRLENRVRTASGDYRWFDWVGAPSGDVFYAVARDITDLKNGQAALEAATDALRQSQKMEAVGQLTGGVAHDFNNLLQVISGNLQLIAHSVAGNAKAEQRVFSAQEAVRRGAKLAGQLLAFGRRQPLEPRVVKIGKLITGMDDLLRRAIGEGIEIETVISGGLWNTWVDPAQIENAILNLAINARDAMEGSGRLTLEAGNAILDDDYVRGLSDVAAGQYVMLAVSDTGHGMSPEVMARALEPFYTTKPVGTGSGLGLSMVYGFVKQSGGHLKVYSEIGEGSTIKIYLPRSHEEEDVVTAVETGLAVGGTETILVAEDEPAVRTTVVEMLGELGYRVLTANDATSALAVIESGVPIDLLFTDVVMPGPLRSPDLARKARERLPGIGVLFTSGYAQNAVWHGGRLDPGTELLQKPYTREALAGKVRHVLAHRPARSAQAAGAAPEAGPAAAAAATAGASMAAPRADTSKVSVLLVEDDEFIRCTTCDMVQELGYSVTGAGSSEAALALLESTPVDILIADVGLPGMSGADLTNQARQRHPGIGIIYATGNHNQPTHLENGPPAVLLCKPYDLTALDLALETVQLARDPGRGPAR
jgi:PAS domain S-box-containing protein